MSEIPLNKYEKEERVIELHKEGKTIRAIAPIVHMIFGPISKIIKAYDKKVQLDKKKENNQQKTKQKKSLSSRAFKLFSKGKTPTQTLIELNSSPEKVDKLWSQFLKSERMEYCYEFFQMCQYDLPMLLSINNFMKRNNIDGKDSLNILRQTKTIRDLQLNQVHLQNEITKLQQTKNNISLKQNNTRHPPLVPLGPLPKYYNW